ncbi:MAG: glycerate kinase [Bacteroidetes bacterium]|nr:glycerate kinase [Bacteroidota bacterium]MDA1119849.1 glycerate kinase [Bacteroidota bacterium]
MRFLIAPNSFKNSLPAWEVADAIEKGILSVKPLATILKRPIADGGDFTMEVLVKALNGDKKSFHAEDPLGRPIMADIGFIKRGSIAIIEMASASGLRLLAPNEYDPMKASSFGTGQLIKYAIDSGAKEIVLTIGGSATVDGGIGLLSSLGFGFISDSGNAVAPNGSGLSEIVSIETYEVDDSIKQCKFTVLCDVENTLLGDFGAAAVFGPQKGADPQMVIHLDDGLKRLNKATIAHLGIDMSRLKGGGAAGGVGATMSAFLNAHLVSGAEYVIETLSIENEIGNMDYVITAEGRIDEQTQDGKAPAVIAKLAAKYDVPTIALSGQVAPNLKTELFRAIFPIINEPTSLEKAFETTEENLQRTASQIANLLS